MLHRLMILLSFALAGSAANAGDDGRLTGTPGMPSANTGLLALTPSGGLLLASGAGVGHETGVAANTIPIFLGLGYGYGPKAYSSAALCLFRSAGSNTLDASFGKNGTTLTPLTPPDNRDYVGLTTLLLDRAGGSFAIGTRGKYYALDSSVDVLTATHHDATGALDVSFGDRGSLIARVDDAGVTTGSAAALDDNGRLLIAGYNGGRRTKTRLGSFDNWSVRIALLRYTAKGRLDTSFGSGGIAVQEIQPEGGRRGKLTREFLREDYKAIGLLPDAGGPALLAAASAEGDTVNLMRFDASGNLDRSFGNAGITRTPADVIVSVLMRDREGRLLVAGVGNARLVLLRYSAKGELDTSYGDGGKREIPLSLDRLRIATGMPLADGGFLLAASGYQNVILARLDSEGALDARFGSGGLIDTALGESVTGANGLALDRNGDPVVGVYNQSGTVQSGVGLVHYGGGISAQTRYRSMDYWPSTTCGASK